MYPATLSPTPVFPDGNSLLLHLIDSKFFDHIHTRYRHRPIDTKPRHPIKPSFLRSLGDTMRRDRLDLRGRTYYGSKRYTSFRGASYKPTVMRY